MTRPGRAWFGSQTGGAAWAALEPGTGACEGATSGRNWSPDSEPNTALRGEKKSKR